MTDEVEAVARRLTKAQRYAIMILSDIWASRAIAGRVIWLPPSILEMAAPLRTGHERVRLTPLGMSVRAYLLEHPND